MLKMNKDLWTEHKLNVHVTFKTLPERILNVLYTFNLRPVSREYLVFIENT